MALNANKKGKNFERKIANELSKEFNCKIRRTPLSGGMDFKGDILCIDDNSIMSEFSWECKNQEKLNIWKALAQSRNDAPRGTIPLVCFTKNFESEYVAVQFNDFVNIVKELEELRNENK